MVAEIAGLSPMRVSAYAILPAVPPNFSFMPSTWKQTFKACIFSGRMWSEKCPGKSIIRSYASDPETMISIDPSNEFEITLSDTTQPVVCAGFRRRKGGHVRILDNLIMGNNTHGPAGKTREDVTGVGYRIGK